VSAGRPPRLPPDAFGPGASGRAGAAAFWVAVVALAFWDLAGRSIFHRDLPRFATIAREMVASGDWLVPTQFGETYANKPILYVWAVAGPSALFGGPNAFWLRLPSALALVGTAWAACLWGTARSGSRAVGRVAGVLAATTLVLTELGRVGRPDMLATAFGTLAAALLDRAVLGRGRASDPWLAGLALGGGLLSKGPVVAIVPLAVVLWPRAAPAVRERLSRARLHVVLPVALLLAAAWVVPVVLREGWGMAERLSGQVTERVAGRGNHVEGPFHYLVTLPLALVPWTAFYVAAAVAFAFRRVRAALGDAAHVGAALAALVVLSAVPTKEVRYASVLVAPLAVALAQAAALLASRATDERRAANGLRAGGVLALLGAAGAVVAAVKVPAAAPWIAVPAALLVLVGVGALRARAEAGTAPEASGRAVALALAAGLAWPAVYWPYLARYLVVETQRENDAVAAVLDPAVPAAILGGKDVHGALDPDDLFDVAGRAAYATSPSALPSRAEAPRLDVVTLDVQVAAAERARGEAARETLRRPRPDGRALVVVRFGGR
jgi:4-amino-4-deoxy-L-arabinose transferase-like glycosyltransferase